MEKSSSRRRRAVVILPIVVILIGLYFVFSGNREKSLYTKGTAMPEFVLLDHKAKFYDSRDLWGKVVAIVFWKVSVESSVAELKGLDQLTKEYKDRGFEAVGISLDEGNSNFVKSFAIRHRVKIPLLIGDVETAHRFGGLRGVPTTFIFNRDGIATDILEGFQGQDDLKKRILKLL